MNNDLNELNDDSILEALDHLFLNGLISASCPICNIPLNEQEYFDCNCEKCGEIDFQKILFRAIDQNNLS